MEDPVTVACRTNSRLDATLVAQGIQIERKRVVEAADWLLEGLSLKAIQLRQKQMYEDADFIDASVKRLRRITC